MNKNALFIPLILLAIQPNKIMGADDRYQETVEALNRRYGTYARSSGKWLTVPTDRWEYSSDNDDVQRLLNEHVNRNLHPLNIIALRIIEWHYPEEEIKGVRMEGRGIKGARREVRTP